MLKVFDSSNFREREGEEKEEEEATKSGIDQGNTNSLHNLQVLYLALLSPFFFIRKKTSIKIDLVKLQRERIRNPCIINCDIMRNQVKH